MSHFHLKAPAQLHRQTSTVRRAHLIPYTTEGTIHKKEDRKTSSEADVVILCAKANSKASNFGSTIFTRKRGRTLPQQPSRQ